MVNRLIPYLGYMPRVIHRLDMYTSGTVTFRHLGQLSASIGGCDLPGMRRMRAQRQCAKQQLPLLLSCFKWRGLMQGSWAWSTPRDVTLHDVRPATSDVAQESSYLQRRCWRRSTYTSSSGGAAWRRPTWPYQRGRRRRSTSQ